MNYLSFLSTLDNWVQANSQILSCGIVGSYARDEAKPSSDVDVCLLVTDVSEFLDNHNWIRAFGSAEKVIRETWGPVETLRVYFEELEVEFNFSKPSWARVPLDFGTASVLGDGITLVCDKNGLLQRAVDATKSNDVITIRNYIAEDAPHLATIFHSAIHTIPESIYNMEQKQAWAPEPSEANFEKWQKRIEVKKPFIAVYKGTVVGFIELEINGHIDCLYVSPDAQRLGVASQLLQYAVNEARAFGLKALHVEASKVAKPFFLHNDFTITANNEVTINNVVLTNYTMRRVI